MRAALIAIALAACDDATAPRPALGGPWRDLGNALVCRGEQALGPPAEPPGGLCVRADLSAGGACATDGDCRSRETCLCGRCTATYCAVASDCDAPRFCDFAEHRCALPCEAGCAAGEQCLAGACRARCLDSSECQTGEVCDGNVCVGDDCSDDTGCLFGERCDVQRVPTLLQEPALLDDVAYLDLADPATPELRAIWRAVSTDGVRFVVDPADRPVLEAARAPSVVERGGVTYLYFEDATGLGVATSTDGVTFADRATVLAGDRRAPAAVAPGDAAIVYYASPGGGIGLATGPLGGPLVDAGEVLAPAAVEVGDGTPGTAFWLGITTLASPAAIVAGPAEAPQLHVYFAAFGRSAADGVRFGEPAAIPPTFSLGFAGAPAADPAALTAWPYGPVVDRVDAFLTHLDEHAPAIAGRRLYYISGAGRLVVLAN
jgi:hypothetical protein